MAASFLWKIERQAVAEQVVRFKADQADIGARRAYVAAELKPVLAIAALFEARYAG
jgi:hypothetical protein